jgi:hypothetical protein
VADGEGQTRSGADLLEQIAALKHDLGKYVAWTSANLDDALWDGPIGDDLDALNDLNDLNDLIMALRADLLATRKHGERREAAWEVWRSYEAELPRPLEPELELVAAAVARLEQFGAALIADDRTAIARGRPEIRAAQLQIRQQLLVLHRRLVARAKER